MMEGCGREKTDAGGSNYQRLSRAMLSFRGGRRWNSCRARGSRPRLRASTGGKTPLRHHMSTIHISDDSSTSHAACSAYIHKVSILFIQLCEWTDERCFLQLYKMLWYFSWRAFDFWTIVSLVTDLLLIAAFTLRMIGMYLPEGEKSSFYHLRSFQVLSYVSPLIW